MSASSGVWECVAVGGGRVVWCIVHCPLAVQLASRDLGRWGGGLSWTELCRLWRPLRDSRAFLRSSASFCHPSRHCSAWARTVHGLSPHPLSHSSSTTTLLLVPHLPTTLLPTIRWATISHYRCKATLTRSPPFAASTSTLPLTREAVTRPATALPSGCTLRLPAACTPCRQRRGWRWSVPSTHSSLAIPVLRHPSSSRRSP